MEPDDIGVVMTRASELHASICDAIDRVTQSRHLGNGSLHVFADEDENEDEEVGATGSSSEEEVRSLEGIREALEVLESQLESLQSVQQQQRMRKDAALAELEESRRILLLRLKEHDGREMQVVEEAMTFAGEPVKETDDLPLPPYLHPISPSIYSESPVFRSVKEKPSLVKQLEDLCSFNDSLFLVDETVSDLEAVNTEVGTERRTERRTEKRTELDTQRGAEMRISEATSPPSGGFSRIFSGVLSFTGKTLLVVVSVVALLAVSDFNLNGKRPQQSHQEVESKPSLTPQRQQAPPNLPHAEPRVEPEADPKPKPKPAPVFECPAGYKRIEDDGIVKCIVKERVELPFPRGINTPDVWHGRG